MSDASIQRIVAAGEARALPPVWVARPELDENVPVGITGALVSAYRDAGGSIEYALFPGARHGFVHFPGADSDKCVAQMVEFIGRQLEGD